MLIKIIIIVVLVFGVAYYILARIKNRDSFTPDASNPENFGVSPDRDAQMLSDAQAKDNKKKIYSASLSQKAVAARTGQWRPLDEDK